MKYFERILFNEIKKWVDRKEIISIKGPRQSGKTTLLNMLMEWLEKEKSVKKENIIFLTFEDKEILEKFFLNPKDFVKKFVLDESQRYYFLIDEAHYCKDVGQKLKLLYDSYQNIKFIITGSSSLEITSETAKFLVGRLLSFELLPLSFYEFLNSRDNGLAKMFLEKYKLVENLILKGKDFEIPKNDIFINDMLRYFEEFVLFGGYPEVAKAENEDEKKIILKNIFNTYLDKDIVSYLQITDTIKFRKLVSIFSMLIGGIIKFESLCSQTKSYFKEITYLTDVLEQTYVIRLVRPFYKNLVTELRKNPKVYFLDYGIRNYAINNFNPLEKRSDAGNLAENFILNEIKPVSENLFLNFWRTTAKAEVDFIVSNSNSGIIPIEVKFEEFRKERIGRSLYSFIRNYSPQFAIVVTKDFWGEKIFNSTKVKFIPIAYF